ncbi:MAG: thioredoxin domain-containing protein, partial [Candidatus Paceibacterota bacterium]
HIRCSSNATITIVEYSDFNCSFCARIHPTLARIVEENEDVQWVYRHFANYAQGRVAAIGSECAARIGGNDVFWEFSDRMFDNQRRLGDAFSIETAVSLGINEQEFRTCLDNSREIEAKLVADRDEAVALGGRGTPFVVVISPTGNLIPFSGALPYEQITAVIEQARNN